MKLNVCMTLTTSINVVRSFSVPPYQLCFFFIYFVLIYLSSHPKINVSKSFDFLYLFFISTFKMYLPLSLLHKEKGTNNSRMFYNYFNPSSYLPFFYFLIKKDLCHDNLHISYLSAMKRVIFFPFHSLHKSR
jgi:hypothetical protein